VSEASSVHVAHPAELGEAELSQRHPVAPGPLDEAERAPGPARRPEEAQPPHHALRGRRTSLAAEGFVDAASSPDGARWWGRHLLPVDPLDSGRVLRAVGGMGTPLRPAQPPPRPAP
jgi:hypothetical protein